MMSSARVGGEVTLPYQDENGDPIPIERGEVIYKMSALTVDGETIRMPSTTIAKITHGVVEEKYLAYGVWSADIRPFSPPAYAKRIKFLVDKEHMNLADVIPMRIEGLDYVRGDAGTHITNIRADEPAGTIIITLSDGVVYTFPLPHAALNEADKATLDNALQTVATEAITIRELSTALQEAVDDTSTGILDALQALQDGVEEMSTISTQVTADSGTAVRARDEATTSAQNAFQSAENAHTHTQGAKGHAEAAEGHAQTAQSHLSAVEDHAQSAQGYSQSAQSARDDAQSAAQEAQQSLQTLQEGIANGDFTGEPGQDGNDGDNGHPTQEQWNALVERVETLESLLPAEEPGEPVDPETPIE